MRISHRIHRTGPSETSRSLPASRRVAGIRFRWTQSKTSRASSSTTVVWLQATVGATVVRPGAPSARRGSGWPVSCTASNASYLVHRGNHLLQRYVHAVGGAAARFAYLDRASSMETLWRVEDSPCVSHHPYGLMSDTHVQIVLNALWREEHGAGCPWSWR